MTWLVFIRMHPPASGLCRARAQTWAHHAEAERTTNNNAVFETIRGQCQSAKQTKLARGREGAKGAAHDRAGRARKHVLVCAQASEVWSSSVVELPADAVVVFEAARQERRTRWAADWRICKTSAVTRRKRKCIYRPIHHGSAEAL